jgi:hypothetical protein
MTRELALEPRNLHFNGNTEEERGFDEDHATLLSPRSPFKSPLPSDQRLQHDHIYLNYAPLVHGGEVTAKHFSQCGAGKVWLPRHLSKQNRQAYITPTRVVLHSWHSI